MYVSGEAGHQQKMLARYRSPGKDRQIAECEWMQSQIALEKIGYGYILPLNLFTNTGCQNWLFYICLLIYFTWNCIHSHLARGDFFLASDSEPAIYVSGKAGHQYTILARYRSPAKNGRK